MRFQVAKIDNTALASCQGKLGYGTKGQALIVLKRMAKKGKGAIRVYRCRFCGQFHIGGKDK